MFWGDETDNDGGRTSVFEDRKRERQPRKRPNKKCSRIEWTSRPREQTRWLGELRSGWLKAEAGSPSVTCTSAPAAAAAK